MKSRIFVMGYLLLVFSATLPWALGLGLPNPTLTRATSWIGLTQGWRMFSLVHKTDDILEVKISFSDGRSVVCNFPCRGEEDPESKYWWNYRFRKMEQIILYSHDIQWLVSSYARDLGRRWSTKFPGVNVTAVEILKIPSRIVDPAESDALQKEPQPDFQAAEKIGEIHF
jgi:hypothetical protein